MILQKAIQNAATTMAAGARVVDVRIGLGYTAVLLDEGRAGVAYTFLNVDKINLALPAGA